MVATDEPNVTVLPLRQDLRLFETAPEKDGSPVWVIQDPVSNRFFRIGWLEYECLLRWPNSAEAIAASINTSTPLTVDAEVVSEFAQFLESNFLVRPSAEGVQRIKQQAHTKGWRTWRWWLKNYLFIRVPVVRPTRFLQKLTPLLEPLFTWYALFSLLGVTAAGILMLLQQWDIFTHSVVDLFSPAGLLGFAFALVLSKSLHEMGHAVVATRQGVRVAHMGVAFLVMWPMLYTDTSESWRLRSHQQRLYISIAGVSVELALAGLATFFWAILSDGLLRDATLYLATTAWIVSLAINISPFMRFDGYFILSDVLGFPNLHERAGALAKVRLRRLVLGIREPDPESFKPSTARWLCIFAYITWLYRLGVFLAIAWAVYTLFFKVLGIFLFVVEILWFVWRPFWSEMVEWKKRWPQVRRTRRVILIGIGLLLFMWAAVPWPVRVEAPAVLHAERQQFVYAPYAAQVMAVHPVGVIEAKQAVIELHAPDLYASADRAQALKLGIEQRLAGLMADEKGRDSYQRLLNQLSEQQAEISATFAELQRLSITAEFSGLWLDVDPTIQKGNWVNEKTRLGVIVDPTSWVVDAYVTQHDIAFIKEGDSASFFMASQWQPITATVLSIDSTRTLRQFPEILDAKHGGSVVTHQRDIDHEVIPLQARYRVRLLVDQTLLPEELVGRVKIKGESRSWLWDKTMALVSLLIQESGF